MKSSPRICVEIISIEIFTFPPHSQVTLYVNLRCNLKFLFERNRYKSYEGRGRGKRRYMDGRKGTVDEDTKEMIVH